MRVGRTVVVGIGNEYRRDDGVGLVVAQKVALRVPGVLDVGPCGEPLDLLGRWDRAGLAVVVDTVSSGDPPGTVRVVEIAAPRGPAAPAPRGPAAPGPTSTHGIGVVGVLRLARAVGEAPRRVVVVGIEGEEFGAGTTLSPAVAGAVEEAVERAVWAATGGVPCA